MNDTKYGLFGTNISVEDVPFDYKSLEDKDIIANNYNDLLMYNKDQHPYYVFVNHDTTTFISEDHMVSPWKKL